MDRKARGIPMMYSTTQRSLFMRLERYYDEMIRAKRTPIFILVGNKADKNQQREVSTLETSAKTRHNVEEAFSNIVRELRVTDEQKAHAAGAKIPTTTAMPSRWSKCVIL
jgi:GTPase KRas protein